MSFDYNALFLDFLETISMCFIDKDFSAWEGRIIYPLSLITAQGPIVLHSKEDAQENKERRVTRPAVGFQSAQQQEGPGKDEYVNQCRQVNGEYQVHPALHGTRDPRVRTG